MWQYYDSSSALKLISLWFSKWSTSQSALCGLIPGPLYPRVYSPSHCSEESSYHINGKYLSHCQMFIVSIFKKNAVNCVLFWYIIRCVFQAMIYSPILVYHIKANRWLINQHWLSLTNNSISYFQLVVYFLFLLLLPLYMFFNSTVKKNEMYGQFFI